MAPNASVWIATERIIPRHGTSATEGQIRFAPAKALWLLAHFVLALTGIAFFFELSALLVFIGLTALTICTGHSVGMHRLLIHRSFQAPLWVEYGLVWLGVLVGMAGPVGMIYTHDMRDWHQRQTTCPPHPAHDAGFWKDAWWQLCCHYELASPPEFHLEARVRDDRFYQALERSWMLHQLPLALLLYVFGGWAWLLFGVSLRITVSLIGHWAVGHFAHRSGSQSWRISGLPVQGYNLRGLGLITFGENWHGNHHAFPHSAKLGLSASELDPGYMFIRGLAMFGLAWDIQTPDSAPPRHGLVKLDH